MFDFKSFRNRIYNINNEHFYDLVFETFFFQLKNNQIYKNYVENLNIDISAIKDIQQIPFLPINFFKTHEIKSGTWHAETVFESSGTTGPLTSRHFIDDLNFYKSHSLENFCFFYGNPEKYHILALLPGYLERETSSLIHMVRHLIQTGQSPFGGFYKDNYKDLVEKIKIINNEETSGRKILLLGITFALLELVEKENIALSKESIVMETGGMKGRRKEIIREEFHDILQHNLKIPSIHAEYGMTELLSQAYSSRDGRFITPPWMKVMTREINDPFGYTTGFGGINIVDLANIHSCSFIETQDIGKINPDGSFQVLGRMDNSDIRGCNLLLS